MSEDVSWIEITSSILGWGYFFAWSLSFYGQFVLNYRNKSVEGVKLEFLTLNLVGFGFYLAYTIKGNFFPDETLGLGKVTIQDFAFAAHAFAISCATYSQIFIYPRGNNKLSLIGRLLLIIYLSIAGLSFFVFQYFEWLSSTENFNLWLLLGHLKLSITIIKYIPQVYWNYRRKSTYGWSIFNILLDITGGTLSVAQNALNILQNGWSQLNPVKFLLGNITILFDVIFIVQHYILYRPVKPQQAGTKLKFVELPEKTT